MGKRRSAEAARSLLTGTKGRVLRLALTGAFICALALAPPTGAADRDNGDLSLPGEVVDAAVPPSFLETTYFSGSGLLTNPVAVRFVSDGRIFVAQKNGVIKVFDSLTDTTADTFADLSANVHNFWDRGLLGFTLDPAFTSGRPFAYVLYAYDAPIGGSPPTWGDACASPPGPTADGCVVSGRLSKLTANGNVMTGPEQVLINDWCQQYPSHSVGSLAFGADGALYVSGGDGASSPSPTTDRTGARSTRVAIRRAA
jgi:glucose/arabinose dehydrogenase